MTLIWTRVDQKMIHGQVALGWVPHLGIDALVVVDAATAADAWAQQIMTLGLPPEIEQTSFVPPDDLLTLLAEKRFGRRRVMVIFKELETALAALAAGLRPETLNLGNQVCRCPERDIRLGDSFFVDQRELEELAEFQRTGLEVLVQAMPNGRALRWHP